MEHEDKILKAGRIAAEVVSYARKIIKPGMPLLDIAEQVDAEIFRKGCKPAFPVCLSINEMAAHYAPLINDKTLASGLLKVDLGVAIDG